jgi:hypothetical protein
LLAADPFNRAAVTLRGDQFAGVTRDRVVGVVQDLRAGDYRQLFVEQIDEAAHEPRLGLAPFAEENDVVPGDKGVLESRQHGAFVTYKALYDGLACRDAPSGVGSNLLFNRS